MSTTVFVELIKRKDTYYGAHPFPSSGEQTAYLYKLPAKKVQKQKKKPSSTKKKPPPAPSNGNNCSSFYVLTFSVSSIWRSMSLDS